MSKHTPGPWRLRPTLVGRSMSEVNGVQIWSADIHVASISRKADKSIQQKSADARLIAAAPELLGVLHNALNHPLTHFSGDMEKQVREAIAKATGTP